MPGECVIVVSHKATLRILISSLLGFDARGYRDRLDQSPACLNVVDFKDPVRARLMLFNDTSHYADKPREAGHEPLEVVGRPLTFEPFKLEQYFARWEFTAAYFRIGLGRKNMPEALARFEEFLSARPPSGRAAASLPRGRSSWPESEN